MKKIANILLWIMLIIFAIFSTIIIGEKIIWKEKTPSIFGYKNFIVLSGSMEPVFNIGDLVFVKKDNDIKEKDIIAFRIDNGIITHRVIEIINKDGEKLYKTKGDANNKEDIELLTLNDIEGKYCFKISHIGSIILFFKTKAGIGILMTILALCLFLNKDSKNDVKEV